MERWEERREQREEMRTERQRGNGTRVGKLKRSKIGWRPLQSFACSLPKQKSNGVLNEVYSEFTQDYNDNLMAPSVARTCSNFELRLEGLVFIAKLADHAERQIVRQTSQSKCNRRPNNQNLKVKNKCKYGGILPSLRPRSYQVAATLELPSGKSINYRRHCQSNGSSDFIQEVHTRSSCTDSSSNDTASFTCSIEPEENQKRSQSSLPPPMMASI